MATGVLAYQMLARHGATIDRRRRDMLVEPSKDDLLQFLAYDAASFVYTFLLATGNAVTPTDRRVLDDLRKAILTTLSKHGIDAGTFGVWPDIRPTA